jgi:PIN domain nuclease of toxin-antitoxin system
VGSESLILLDTHALVWWATGAAELSAKARRAIQAEAAHRGVGASAISLFEIATAARRGRLRFNVSPEQWLADLLLLPEIAIEPVSAAIARLAGSFDDSMPGDPADRMIVATAIELQARLVTADDRLRRVRQVETVW